MDTSENTRYLRQFPVLYGTTMALLWAVCSTIILFLWMHFGHISDSVVTIITYIIHCTATFFGGFKASRCVSERGWYYGGLTGLLYAAFMIFVGLVVYNTFSMDAGGGFRSVLMVLVGAFAGIIGINSNSR
jgi:putative membrane protein (TIGR04086 family)